MFSNTEFEALSPLLLQCVLLCKSLLGMQQESSSRCSLTLNSERKRGQATNYRTRLYMALTASPAVLGFFLQAVAIRRVSQQSRQLMDTVLFSLW